MIFGWRSTWVAGSERRELLTTSRADKPCASPRRRTGTTVERRPRHPWAPPASDHVSGPPLGSSLRPRVMAGNICPATTIVLHPTALTPPPSSRRTLIAT